MLFGKARTAAEFLFETRISMLAKCVVCASRFTMTERTPGTFDTRDLNVVRRRIARAWPKLTSFASGESAKLPVPKSARNAVTLPVPMTVEPPSGNKSDNTSAIGFTNTCSAVPANTRPIGERLLFVNTNAPESPLDANATPVLSTAIWFVKCDVYVSPAPEPQEPPFVYSTNTSTSTPTTVEFVSPVVRPYFDTANPVARSGAAVANPVPTVTDCKPYNGCPALSMFETTSAAAESVFEVFVSLRNDTRATVVSPASEHAGVLSKAPTVRTLVFSTPTKTCAFEIA
jgi:hypothetical protein